MNPTTPIWIAMIANLILVAGVLYRSGEMVGRVNQVLIDFGEQMKSLRSDHKELAREFIESREKHVNLLAQLNGQQQGLAQLMQSLERRLSHG